MDIKTFTSRYLVGWSLVFFLAAAALPTVAKAAIGDSELEAIEEVQR
jgi:hypothetical protein